MGFRETILSEAMVLFEQKGIKAVSTENLLEALDISRGTLHEIAHTKNDLVQLCLKHSLQERRAVADKVLAETVNPLEALLQLLQISIEEAYSFNTTFVQDLREEYPGSWARLALFMRTFSREYINPLVTACIEEGYFQKDLHPELMARLILNQIQVSLNPQLFPTLTYDYQELFKVVIVYFLRGCATQRGVMQIENFTCKSMAV